MSAVLLVVIGVMYLVFKPASTPIGEDLYVRELFVMLDQTGSMDTEFIREAKALITEHVFPYLGPGDKAACYSVGVYGYGIPFDESHNRVFSDGLVLPPVPANAARPLKKEMPAQWKPILAERWRQADSIKVAWTNDVEELKEPLQKGSPYLQAIEYTAERFRESQQIKSITGRWLIVIGDLYHQYPNAQFQSLKPPAPQDEYAAVFKDVNVWLVVPYGVLSPEIKERVIEFWRQYFSDRGNNQVTIGTFDGFKNRFPASLVPRW
jgi:hypothetical protein